MRNDYADNMMASNMSNPQNDKIFVLEEVKQSFHLRQCRSPVMYIANSNCKCVEWSPA